jgi:hypothetical protein
MQRHERFVRKIIGKVVEEMTHPATKQESVFFLGRYITNLDTRDLGTLSFRN